MKNLLYIILLLFVIISCKDFNLPDYKFYEKNEISGIAYLFDEESGTDKVIAANKIIKLCLDKEGKNCILTDTTNNNGEFIFDYKPIETSATLYLFSELKENNINYKSSQQITILKQISFDIKTAYMNGIKVKLKTLLNNEPISDVKVYLFRNRELAKSYLFEIDTTKIKNFESSKKTNKYGIAFFGDIKKLDKTLKYHLLLVDLLNKRTYLKENVDTLKSISNDIMGMILTKKYTINNTLTDEVIKGNIKFDLLDVNNKVVKSDSTNKFGEIKSSYFFETTDPVTKIRGNSTINDIDYSGELNNLKVGDLVLSSINQNTIKVKVIDNEELPISGLSVILFKNLALARLASKTLQITEGIKKTTTNLNGIAFFTKLDEMPQGNLANHILIIQPDKKISYLIENLPSNSDASKPQNISYNSFTKNIVITDNVLEEDLSNNIESNLTDNKGRVLSKVSQSNSKPFEFAYFFIGNDPKYNISTNTTIKGVDYSGNLSNFANDKIVLSPAYKNAIKLKISSKNEDVLGGLKVYLYNNLDLANAASSKGIPTSFISESVSNNRGISVFGNLDEGRYHILILSAINEIKFNRVIPNIDLKNTIEVLPPEVF